MAGHCWAVTSGKGGVGKSVIALGLAQAWRNEGKRVLLVDAHTGMANLDVLMGVNPTEDFWQWLGGANAQTISEGLDFVGGASGWQEWSTRQSDALQTQLKERLAALDYDIVVLDTASGVHPLSVAIVGAADTALLVLTGEPTCVVDSLVLRQAASEPENWRAVLNMTSNRMFSPTRLKVKQAWAHALNEELAVMGNIPPDPAMLEAVQFRQGVLERAPKSASAQALTYLASVLPCEPLRADSQADLIAHIRGAKSGASVAEEAPADIPQAA